MADFVSGSGPQHGGDLVTASKRYGIDIQDWLDLSTGINPDPYPVPEIPPAVFHRLPAQPQEHLLEIARAYYGVDSLLVGAGSQAFIELLPRLREKCRVAIPDVGYQEHAWHWRKCGHEIEFYSGSHPGELNDRICAGRVDCAVVINPNNPTTAAVATEQLLEWQRRLAERGGWLIIDEAFVDAEQRCRSSCSSFSEYSTLPGVIILRSLGKFFGLAGVRIGFALASIELLKKLADALGLWSVSTVSHYVAACALEDSRWQADTRELLASHSDWMYSLLSAHFPSKEIYQASLFVSLALDSERAEAVHHRLAQEGVLTRLWPLVGGCESLLRFGLIGGKDHRNRSRLADVLGEV